MHGLILNEFKKYFIEARGPEAWEPLLRQAGLGQEIFLPDHVYPDPQFLALLQSAAQRSDQDPHDLQESFGRFLGPHLMQMYETQVSPAWRALDLIDNVESAIHRVVRIRDPNADPPRLKSTRLSKEEVLIQYTSPRRLCGVAKGIARGVADAFGEVLDITEDRCMRRGDPACDIRFRNAPSPA